MVDKKLVLTGEEEEEVTIPDIVGAMVGVAIGATLIPVIMDALKRTLYVLSEQYLWVASPSGETTTELPFYTALRVVRKQGWELAEVEPVKHLSRWEYIKLAIIGRRGNNGLN